LVVLHKRLPFGIVRRAYQLLVNYLLRLVSASFEAGTVEPHTESF
jgi:hypothetical protein